MVHEGERLEREIKHRERELEQVIDSKRRLEVQQAINQLKLKLAAWKRPH